jgi:hypothetical protein
LTKCATFSSDFLNSSFCHAMFWCRCFILRIWTKHISIAIR